MKFTFRSIQALTIGTTLGYWGTRFALDPHHAHYTLLAMSAVAFILSELGFRAGKREAELFSKQATKFVGK